jgi:Fe-S-cluster containining protein
MNRSIANRQSAMDRYFWLSHHLAYACRHSGACCTARWPIPIERDRVAAVQAAIASGRVCAPSGWYRPVAEAPDEVAGVLALQPTGACAFYRPTADRGAAITGRCAIHAMRPGSCRHFPYACVVDPRGVHVTLSHFCPTAASLLFDDDAEVRVVEGPPVFGDGGEPEGLDAREALPPVSPGTRHPTRSTAPGTRHPARRTARCTVKPAPSTRPTLMSWEEVTAWERDFVAALAVDSRTPAAPSLVSFNRARNAVPSPWSWPAPPAEVARGWQDLVAPAWPRWTRVIGRYLASKAHASWAMHLGAGPRDVEALVELARSVVQVEAVRACRCRARALDRSTLIEAIRQADLLLMHHADPVRLCQF